MRLEWQFETDYFKQLGFFLVSTQTVARWFVVICKALSMLLQVLLPFSLFWSTIEHMEEKIPSTKVLTITQFAKRHAVCRRTIFNWFKAGKLPPDALNMYQLPSGHWRIEVFRNFTTKQWNGLTKDQQWAELQATVNVLDGAK